MTCITAEEIDKALNTWINHHPWDTYKQSIVAFNKFTGISPIVYRKQLTEKQIQRIKHLAGPYGRALLAIHLAQEGKTHGTGQ
jgi:hypothetical protein